MFGRATIPAKEIIPVQDQAGGSEKNLVRPRPEPQYKAIGILYVKATADILDFRIIYEGHISDEVQSTVAELFGVGAVRWLER